MNISIFEEAIQSGVGHWPLYIGDIAGSLRQAGDRVDLLVHKHADDLLLKRLSATPWLSRNCWLDPQKGGPLAKLRYASSYAREVSAWLRTSRDITWVCALTMRLHHLLAFSLLCRRPWHRGHRRYLLLFVQGFGTYQGPSLPVCFSSNPSTRLARCCFQILAPAVRSGRVLLAAETRAMQDELMAFSQLPVILFPHPVSPPDQLTRLAATSEESHNKSLTITCPGFARYEKGSDLMQDACRNLFAIESHRKLQVIGQWSHPFPLPDGSMAEPDVALIDQGRLKLINQSLNPAAYSSLIIQSDLIVLPYRRSSYHNRVSRVAIEAALHGTPLVYMSGTWIEEVVELTGAGVAIAEETAQSVTHALRTALDQLPALRVAARNAVALVAQRYSADRFRQLLLDS